MEKKITQLQVALAQLSVDLQETNASLSHITECEKRLDAVLTHLEGVVGFIFKG